VLLAALACDDNSDELESADPQVLWGQAEAAMAGLRSYHVAPLVEIEAPR